MNFTLHQLQVFLKVAQLKSITKAAEELHLTQPAVSIQLRNFQDQFDVPLLEVVGRKLYITEFGEEMAKAAGRIVAEVRNISMQAQSFKGGLAGKLSISVVSTGKYVMPYFLTDFLNEHPAVELELDVTNKARVITHLERNEVDFALVSILPEKPALEALPLMDNRLFLVAGGNQSFPKKSYDHRIMAEMPIILREEGSATRLVAERYFRQKGVTLGRKLELTSNEAVKQAVIAGLGCSIMPVIGLRNELERGDLKIIPVKGFPIVSTWNLVWPRNKQHSPVAAAYLRFMSDRMAQIIEDRFSWVQVY